MNRHNRSNRNQSNIQKINNKQICHNKTNFQVNPNLTSPKI